MLPARQAQIFVACKPSLLERHMKKLMLVGAIVLGAATLSVSPVSLNWSGTQGVSVSQDKAYAVIGRPATPGSVAGVARRTTRRAVRRHY
jgi:hypothetical protein